MVWEGGGRVVKSKKRKLRERGALKKGVRGHWGKTGRQRK